MLIAIDMSCYLSMFGLKERVRKMWFFYILFIWFERKSEYKYMFSIFFYKKYKEMIEIENDSLHIFFSLQLHNYTHEKKIIRN